ncbi:hypothetical protein Naga_100023g16 [Nannochloropsis gaditana]|uniref:DOT1 domain-containing protein n=1 Tax=Nannochloropsis gaditana TaxID=72520 RepID=W7TGM7_9STRA|nr:hypothetical protein Naga_100023g16 [Nannochloropsis gaditana]
MSQPLTLWTFHSILSYSKQAGAADLMFAGGNSLADTEFSLASPTKRTGLPSFPPSQKNAGCAEDKDEEDSGNLKLGRKIYLFSDNDGEADVDFEKKGTGKEENGAKDDCPHSLFSTPQKPRSTKSFATPTSIQCSPSVKNVYSIIRRCTGSLGGNGSGGAIYGELTTGSMQRVVDMMVTHCALGRDSIFIDIGAGLGKPNIHVSQYPGVAASYGIEHEQVRWQLSLHNLRHLLQAAGAEAKDGETADAKADERGAEMSGSGRISEEFASSRINHKIFFHYGDVTEARTLDPFTHVYMFDIGFPPTLFYEIADRFNISQCPFLICYHGPKLIVDRYGFDVTLISQVQTSMHGSSEGHTAYCYKRTKTKRRSLKVSPVDALFKEGLDMIREGSLESLHAWVKQKMDIHFTSPRPARRRRSTNLFLNQM